MSGQRRVGEPLYDAAEVAAAVERLAALIAADHRGKPLVLLGVLKGALYLTVDLARALAGIADGPSEIIVGYACVGSYGMSDRSSGTVRMLMEPTVSVAGRHVVIADDVADNGFTLAYVREHLLARGPSSVRTCVLFDKPANRRVDVPLHYVGLTAPQAFIVGYGLDYQELYRNLPYVAALGEPIAV